LLSRNQHKKPEQPYVTFHPQHEAQLLVRFGHGSVTLGLQTRACWPDQSKTMSRTVALKILDKIPSMDDNSLAKLLGNAQTLLAKNPENEDAQVAINAVQAEWAHRLALFKEGNYKASTPENGVLSVVGYKVGNDGGSETQRRLKLDFIMTGVLPPVASPAYIAEWGEPKTRDRYRKLHRVIRVLASSNKSFPNRELAVQQWEDDLVYLEQTWASV
jgi:hypothetical protein